jgi:hypothetical protein
LFVGLSVGASVGGGSFCVVAVVVTVTFVVVYVVLPPAPSELGAVVVVSVGSGSTGSASTPSCFCVVAVVCTGKRVKGGAVVETAGRVCSVGNVGVTDGRGAFGCVTPDSLGAAVVGDSVGKREGIPVGSEGVLLPVGVSVGVIVVVTVVVVVVTSVTDVSTGILGMLCGCWWR